MSLEEKRFLALAPNKDNPKGMWEQKYCVLLSDAQAEIDKWKSGQAAETVKVIRAEATIKSLESQVEELKGRLNAFGYIETSHGWIYQDLTQQ